MSRSLDRDDSERVSAVTRGQGGGSASEETERRPEDKANRRNSDGGGGGSHTQLAGIINRAAADKPTMSEFVARLEKSGVNVVPSVQSSGRLNGMSYRFKGATVKGSRLGREYTAQGLQNRKGVQYDAARDDGALRQSLEKAGFSRPDNAATPSQPGRNPQEDRAARLRDRTSGLNSDQQATLAEIGKFRTLKAEDVIRHRYDGNESRFRQDIRVLSEAGLAEQRTVRHLKSGQEFKVVVLIQKGRNGLRKLERDKPEGETRQQFHAGFVKPGEVRHDAGIYRMYQAEKSHIERDGGKVKRVVLDFELKKEVFGKLNRAGDRSDPQYDARKLDIANENGLKVVEGRVVFPDLRIEYERGDQEMGKVDLELATADYKGSQIQAKHAAGLKIYAPDSAAGSPAFQDPEIVAGLISL